MKVRYPWLALGLGLILALLSLFFGNAGTSEARKLPLLTLLLMSEFGFLLTAVAAGICARDLWKQGLGAQVVLLFAGNAALAANFAWMGLALWPH